MVAKIKSPHSLSRAINYNEKKLQKGLAECIYAGNYIKDPEHLKFHEKLSRLQNLIVLNDRTIKTNTLHISLNFHPTENFSKEKLVDIASTYISKIGFGEQPYLVYQHQDAGHPHIHIVTTNIKADGKRIDTFNIGRNQSEKARKEIEEMYSLIKASGRNQKIGETIEPVNVQRVQYGKAETKRAITNVLDAVINQYRYTSLPELNAVLKLYNIIADRGKEDGRIYKTNGLLYKILDENGNKVGVPIKASSIYSKPTLHNLEKKFRQNEILRQEHRKYLKTSIDWIMVKPPRNLELFRQALQKEKISLVVRQNDQGTIYGMTYIDHRTKCVFNGSDIGKEYSAKTILEKCGHKQQLNNAREGLPQQNIIKTSAAINKNTDDKLDWQSQPGKIIDTVINPAGGYDYLPYDLRKKKKRKRKPN